MSDNVNSIAITQAHSSGFVNGLDAVQRIIEDLEDFKEGEDV